jgi:hypothetical protein
MQVLDVLVKKLGICHAHEHQTARPGRLGRVDGGAALCKLQIGAFLAAAK